MKKGKSMKKQFTLIELLTVIAVIGILAGMLLPALSSARNKAKATVCISQLKQVSLALHIYATDSRNKMPDRSDEDGEDKYYAAFTSHSLGSLVNFKSVVDRGYVPPPKSGNYRSLTENSVLSCPITQNDPDEDIQYAGGYNGVCVSYAPSAHMFGVSCSNYDRYPSGALLCDGSNSGVMGTIFNYGYILWRHGSNAPAYKNSTINGGSASAGFLGSIGDSEQGSGTANMLLADGSITNFDIASRSTVL